MPRSPDARFAKVVALMRSTQHSGERENARASAEVMAASYGMSLDDALAQVDAPTTSPAPPNTFAGFDEWMEQREPGWGARQRRERDERRTAMLARKAGLIERFGSFEAAVAPCWREELLLDAVRAWRKPFRRPYQRWTECVDGYTSFLCKPSDRLRTAIEDAYPLPTTFADAKQEHAYWDQRRRDLEDLHDGDRGDDALDLVCQIRADIVRRLAEHGLPATSLAQLHGRMVLARGGEVDPEMFHAVFRDLTALVEREARRGSSLQPSTTLGGRS